MAPTSAMPACRFVLIWSLAFWNRVFLPAARGEPLPLEETSIYLRGTADPDRDPLALTTAEGYVCSNVTRECYCRGLNCSLLADVVLRTNLTVLTLTETSIQKVPSRAYTLLPQLEILEIIQGNLSVIEPYAFNGLKRLRVLNLCFNQLPMLHYKSFVGLESLEDLVLMKNQFQSFQAIVPALVPAVLPSLRFVHLSGNSLKKIHNDTFSEMRGSKLDFLHMIFCGLNEIHPKGLEPLVNLRTIMIRANAELDEPVLSPVFENPLLPKLTTVEIGATQFSHFPFRLFSAIGKTQVSTLSLYGLPLTILENGSFPDMRNLQSLHLKSSHVEQIEKDALQPLSDLRSLVMPKNLMTIFPNALRFLRLESLDISGVRNHVLRFDLPEFTFSGMADLKILDLSYKSLLTLHKNTFYGLSNLTQLNVRKCGISSIKDGAFTHLTSLRILDLSENPLFELGDAVSEKLFRGLRGTLESLLLQNVGYRGEPDRFWDELERLRTLDISNNTLSKISSILPRLKNLKSLYASSNDIQEWNDPVLTGNLTLETLDLSKNFLRAVTAAMISDFRRVVNLDVSQNRFKCDCDLREFLSWLNDTQTKVSLFKRAKKQMFICTEPERYSNAKVRELRSLLESACNDLSGLRARFVLVALAALLVVVFTLTLFIYICRRRVQETSWIKHDGGHFTYDAFVSYSANDSDWVFNNLLPHIETSTSNLRLCVYDRDFLAGQAITDCILESIKNSRTVLLVVSNNFVKSPWCRLETELARHVLLDNNREGLLLIRLGQLDLSQVNAHLRFLLSTRLYLSWTGDPKEQEAFWVKLRRALNSNPRKVDTETEKSSTL